MALLLAVRRLLPLTLFIVLELFRPTKRRITSPITHHSLEIKQQIKGKNLPPIAPII
jgi:hypothetical protein